MVESSGQNLALAKNHRHRDVASNGGVLDLEQQAHAVRLRGRPMDRPVECDWCCFASAMDSGAGGGRSRLPTYVEQVTKDELAAGFADERRRREDKGEDEQPAR